MTCPLRGSLPHSPPTPGDGSKDEQHHRDDEYPAQGFDRKTNAAQNQGDHDDDDGSGHRVPPLMQRGLVPRLSPIQTAGTTKGPAGAEYH